MNGDKMKANGLKEIPNAIRWANLAGQILNETSALQLLAHVVVGVLITSLTFTPELTTSKSWRRRRQNLYKRKIELERAERIVELRYNNRGRSSNFRMRITRRCRCSRR